VDGVRGKSMKPANMAIGIWLLATALLWLGSATIDSGFVFIPFILIFGPLWLGAGVILLALSFERRFRWQATIVRCTLLVGVMATAFLFGAQLSQWGSRVALRIQFAWRRPDVEHLHADIQAGRLHPAKGNNKASFGDYLFDAGPPVRLAVSLGGIIDNWCGFVRDPTGVVMTPDASIPFEEGNTTQVRKARYLLGGYLVSCRPLAPPYYHCCFT
jgi:hypothetical protein